MSEHPTQPPSKPPAAEERVTIVYTLQQLEAVMKALVARMHALEDGDGAKALPITKAAIRTTKQAIETAVAKRKAKDL
jgi:hypothetical protein